MTTFAAEESWRWLGLHAVDWIVLVAYFLLIMGIGIWSYKRVKDMTDFFMGGRRFGKIFMMFFAFGSGTSSEQAVTVVAGTWRGGLVGIWWQLLWIFATPFYWIVAPVMRRMRALTTADFFQSRFGTSTATLYSLYGIIISVVFLAGLLFASGKMVNALTGGKLEEEAKRIDWQVPSVKWDKETKGFYAESRRVQGYEYAVLAMTAMFVIYGMAGGLGAAILTDFVQGILTIAFSFLLLPFVFQMIGGFGEMNQQADVKEGMLNIVASTEAAASLGKEPLTVFAVFMLSLTALAGIVVQPHIMGVCGAGKTEFEGRFGFTVGNFLKRFCTMAWTFTGLACIVWYLGTNSPLLHQDRPLDEKSAAFQKLSDEDKEKVRGLSDEQRKKIAEDRKLHTVLNQRTNFDEFKATVIAKGMSPQEQQNLDQIKQKLKDASRSDRRARMKVEFARLDGQLKSLPAAQKKKIEKQLNAETKAVDDADKTFSDELFGRAAYDILPIGLLGLLLASLMAAMMSSGDAQMVVSSGLFTDNIYRRFLVRHATERHYLWVGRIAGLLIVTVALVLQSSFTDVIDAIKIVIKTPAAIGISLWFGIIWRRWTSLAVWVSTICSAATWWFVAYRPDVMQQWNEAAGGGFDFMFANPDKMLDAWQMVCYISAGVITGIVTSLITPRTPADKLDQFFSLIHTPVRRGEEVEAPCTLPAGHPPAEEKLFNLADVEVPKPTWVDISGFITAWVLVGVIIWLTMHLAAIW